MLLATLCTNGQCCCLPLHMAVRLTPFVDSVQVWTCYSCYRIVDSVWSEVVFVRCVTKMDLQKFEQGCAIKVCVKLGESATVTYEKLQRAYGEHSLSRTNVFRWKKFFLEGGEQMEEEPGAGRTSTSKTEGNVERVRSLVRSDRRLTLRMISSELNFNRFTVYQILSQDLDMRKVWAKMVPKNLTTEQKANRKDVSWSSGPTWEGARILQSRYHRRWIMDFGVRPREKTPNSGVAHGTLSPSQESENEQIQNEIDAHLFFWQSGDRPQGIWVTKTNCQSNFLLRSPWGTQEKDGTCAHRLCTHLDAAPWQRPMSHGSLHQWIFGRKKQSSTSWAPYSPDFSPCDFFYSPGSKTTWKSAILVLWITTRTA